MTIRTTPSNSYLHPSADEVRQLAKELKVGAYAPDLVEDLCNIASGGSFVSASDIFDQCTNNFNKLLEPDSDGDYRLPDSHELNYTKNYSEAREAWVEKDVGYHQNIQTFLQTLNLDGIPGTTPLEKSLNTIKYLGEQATPSSDSSDSSGSPTIPIFSTFEGKVKEVAKKINEAIEIVEKLDQEDKELLDLNGDDNSNIESLVKSDVMADILRASNEMDNISSIKTKPSSKLIKDDQGDVKIARSIKGFDEFHRINPLEFVNPLPMMAYRVINSEARVDEKYKREFKMPFVTLIVDDSGSMNSNSKSNKAIGIIHNILKRVKRGECWLNFSFFESSCHKFYLLPDDGNIDEFYRKKIVKHPFNKGGTDVANAIKEALEEFDKIALENKAAISSKDRHIIVVNDGEDDATSVKSTDLKGAKLHSFILNSSNDHLKMISAATGGIYRQDI
jgi:hypothetical protein